MNIILTADWHFGHPGKLKDLIWSFNKMIDYCIINDVKIIAILGDLTHNREHIDHDISNTISDLFDKANKNNISIISFIGNHDMFYRHRWSINAVKPFSKQITYIEQVSYFVIDNTKFWVIPFIEHEPSYMKVLKDVNKLACENDILLTHIGVVSASMNSCFLVQNWNLVSFENTKFKRVYSGHFHCYQKVGSKSWFVGSPIPFRFDEGMVPHGFINYNTENNEHIFIDLLDEKNKDTPPDYITVASDSINDIINNCSNDNIRVQLQDGDNSKEISKKLKEAGALKVTFIKPKEESQIAESISNRKKHKDIFKSWINFDNPKDLNYKLLIELNNQIKSDTKMEEIDDKY